MNERRASLLADTAWSLLCDPNVMRAIELQRARRPRIAPALPPPVASPDGTQLTIWSGGALTDKAGDVWRLDGPGTSVGGGITLNARYCGQGAVLLTIRAGVIWGQHILGDWFTLVAPGVATPQAGAPP